MTLLEFATLLETTGREQCYGHLQDNGKCCAVGLVAIDIGIPANMRVYNNPIILKLDDDYHELIGRSVTNTNDVQKLTFKEIAKLIRKKLELKGKVNEVA